jgi:hypothetical protein
MQMHNPSSSTKKHRPFHSSSKKNIQKTGSESKHSRKSSMQTRNNQVFDEISSMTKSKLGELLLTISESEL